MAASHQRNTLQSFSFATGDTKSEGRVEVVHRISTFDGGNTREFIDLNIVTSAVRDGEKFERFVGIPVRYIDEVIEALQRAKPLAEEEIRKLTEKSQNDPRNDGGGQSNRRRHDGGRRDGGRGYREG